jgi:hypothetical protein
VTERGVVQDDVRKCLVDLGMVVRWATGTPVWLNGTQKVSSPTLRCSVHVSGISDVSDVSPRRFHRRPGAYQIEIACDAGRFLVLFCCARMARSCSINRPSNLGRAFYLHVDTCYKRTGRSLRTRRSDEPTNKDDKRQKKSRFPTLCASWSMSTV